MAHSCLQAAFVLDSAACVHDAAESWNFSEPRIRQRSTRTAAVVLDRSRAYGPSSPFRSETAGRIGRPVGFEGAAEKGNKDPGNTSPILHGLTIA
jgi:hypothetical protein